MSAENPIEATASGAASGMSADEEPKDLGFGAAIGREHEQRLLNRDGTFNVRRHGLRFWESLSLYHSALSMGWTHFLGMLAGGYLLLNALFAAAYLLCGRDALGGDSADSLGGPFWKAFFFSVHTFATIGYGSIVPRGIAANVLVTIESLFGLLGFALATGLLFSRFSRPTGKLLFSKTAIIAPYRGMTAFMFRIVNARSSQLIELDVKVQFSRIESRAGGPIRKYDQLTLERTHVVFFPLSWTVVHPITEKSPLYGLSHEDLVERDAEFLILLSGVDETFSQTVHSRSSYKPEEIVFGARFANIYNPLSPEGLVSIDVSKLHDITPVDLESETMMSETSTWHHTGHFAGYVPAREQTTDDGRRQSSGKTS